MKKIKQILFLSLFAVLTACTEDAFVPQSEVISSTEDGIIDMISMTVPDIEMDAMTRSKLIDDGTELKFEWQENDAIGVVPMSGNPLRFPIHAENAGKNTALFDGGDWALKTNTKYAAFFPMKGSNIYDGIGAVSFDYTGQTQGNYTDYDFMATGAVKPKDGEVKFTMQRLSAILKISITMPAGSITRYGTLIAPSAVFGVKGKLDLSGNELVINPEGYVKMIHTDLGLEKQSSSTWKYEAYMMIPPADLNGETLTFRLTSDDGYAYEATLTGKNFEAGKAYQLSGTARSAVIKNTNLIAAAERNNSITFIKESGKVNVNDNLESINWVTNIDVTETGDPNVCDEISYFFNLENLECAYNMISSLDVSNNTALTVLYCSDNQLTSLDVSNCKALKRLWCDENQLTSLDVSSNTTLGILDCSDNQLTSLDVSNNMALKTLSCNFNQLTSLDVSNNIALGYLYCYNNQLTSLDVSNNTRLEELSCGANQLTSLDVSNNTELTSLYCGENQLTSLDVSNNTRLKELSCGTNQLASLDVTNNTELTTLYCSENSFETFSVIGLSSLRTLDMYNCKSLTQLDCNNNHLSSLDVSNCTALKTLNCQKNYLTSLDISSLSSLKNLDCNANRMSVLYISALYPTLYKYNVFCGNQKTSSGENQKLTLTVNANDQTTLREEILRNYNVVIVYN